MSRPNSLYCTACVCGFALESVERTGTCGGCGRKFEINWPADIGPTGDNLQPPRTITAMYDEDRRKGTD